MLADLQAAVAQGSAAAYGRANLTHVDVASLNFIEAFWLRLFLNNDRPELTLAAALFVVHQVAYLGRFLPYYIMDQIPFFLKYKIQGTPAPIAHVWKVLYYVTVSQALVMLPMMTCFYASCVILGVEVYSVPFPPLWLVALQQVWFAVCEDTFHYWLHRAAHEVPWIYRNVHKVHHEFTKPFGIAAEYAHPLEVLFLGLGFFVGPLSWALLAPALAPASAPARLRQLHVAGVAAWVAVRVILTVDDHSGYDFPWSLHRALPFWGG
ncbi:C-4 sterol methyl oxidase, partial [Cladochytrium tenue]